MTGPMFIEVLEYDHKFGASVNIEHIILVGDTDNPQVAMLWLHGEKAALKVVGSRREILLRILDVARTR
jgi:hypothetical protein